MVNTIAMAGPQALSLPMESTLTLAGDQPRPYPRRPAQALPGSGTIAVAGPAAPARATLDAHTLYALQYLRGIAALVIVVYHICRFREFGAAMQGTLFRAASDAFAPAAVDLFFALSGFLMVYTQAVRPRSGGQFLWRRAARIVPAYWAMTVAFFALMALSANASHPNPDTPRDLAASLAFVSQWTGHAFPIILPGWSLEYEMIFYALMALAIWRCGARFALATSAAVIACVGLGMLQPIALEFVLGMAAGAVFPRRLPPAWAIPAGILAMALFGWGSWSTGGHFANEWLRLAIWGVPMFVLLLNGLNLPQVRVPPLLFLAECSYSIYVSHHLSITVYAKLVSSGLIRTGWGALGVVSCFAFCVAAGIAVHRLVERTADDFLRRLGKRAG